jgi:hypothetical protein
MAASLVPSREREFLMPLDPKQLESFARGPRPGDEELDADLLADIDEEAEGTPDAPDADDMLEFEEPMAGLVQALESHAEDIDELALELSDDQLDVPSEEPSEEDRATVLRHADEGELDPDVLRLAKAALPDLDLEMAEKIGEHLVREGMLEDAAPVVAYLLVLAAEIDNIEVPESDEDLEDVDLENEEGDDDEEYAEEEEMPA